MKLINCDSHLNFNRQPIDLLIALAPSFEIVCHAKQQQWQVDWDRVDIARVVLCEKGSSVGIQHLSVNSPQAVMHWKQFRVNILYLNYFILLKS